MYSSCFVLENSFYMSKDGIKSWQEKICRNNILFYLFIFIDGLSKKYENILKYIKPY